jgi:hypothetical protein
LNLTGFSPPIAIASASGTTLQLSIVRIITSFPNAESPVDVPSESPTVPKAETTSNRVSAKSLGVSRYDFPHPYETDTIITTPNTRIMLAVRSDTVLETTSCGIVLLNKKASSLPRALFLTNANRTANADVFIPPPHEPEDAPMNIRSMSM